MTAPTSNNILRTPYQQTVAEYWNKENDPVNLRLGDVDGLYHHHYGIGVVDLSVLEGPENTRDERTIAELHQLETAQADFLIDHLGDVKPTGRLLPGRGAAAPASWPTSVSAAGSRA